MLWGEDAAWYAAISASLTTMGSPARIFTTAHERSSADLAGIAASVSAAIRAL